MPFLDPLDLPVLRCLQLLKHDWIHSFMFPKDRQTKIDQLHHALSQPFLITGNFGITTQAINQPIPHSEKFELDERLKSTFAPSFSTGKLSVGFEVNQPIKTSNPMSSTTSFTSRVARDDEAGLVLGIADHVETGLTEIGSIIQVSPGCRALMMMHVHTQPFHQLVNASSPEIDIEQFRKTIAFSLHSVDVQKCPMCGITSFDGCSCKIVLPFKKHPLDLECERKNMQSYMGDNQGMAFLNVYDKGKVVFLGSYSARISCSVVKDSCFERSMAVWAMRDALESKPINVLKLGMPPSSTTPIPSNSSHDIDDLLVDPPLVSTESSANAPGYACSMVDLENLDDDIIPGTSIPKEAELPDPIVTSLPLGRIPELRCEAATATEAVEEAPRQDAPSPVRAIGLHSSVPVSCETAILPRSTVQMPINPTSETDMPCYRRVVTSSASSVASAGGIFPKIAPASGNITRSDTFADELRRRSEYRKARNRLSAQRCNEKKRLQLKQLKDDIANEAKKELTLRRKENALREENSVLKAAVNDQ